jgi:DNA polymerase
MPKKVKEEEGGPVSRAEALAVLGRYLEELRETGVDWLPLHGVSQRAETAELAGRQERETLEAIRTDLGDCHRCALGNSRTRLVFGVGNPHASVVFVGEAPGRDEDLQGEPFVGEAGQLLTRIIQAMGFARDEVYICNVLKCRPPKNRDPLPEEIEACGVFMLRQVLAIAPRVVVALGTFAAQTLLETKAPISRLRGTFHDYHGIPLMPTFHPAFLLRSPEMKRQVWEDMQQVMKRVGKESPVPRP